MTIKLVGSVLFFFCTLSQAVAGLDTLRGFVDQPSLWTMPPLHFLKNTTHATNVTSVPLVGFGASRASVVASARRRRGVNDFTLHYSDAAVEVDSNTYLYGLPISLSSLEAVLQKAVDSAPKVTDNGDGQRFLSVETEDWQFVLHPTVGVDGNPAWLSDWPKVIQILRKAAKTPPGHNRTFVGTITDPTGRFIGEVGMTPTKFLTPAPPGAVANHNISTTDPSASSCVACKRARTLIIFDDTLPGYGMTWTNMKTRVSMTAVAMLLQTLSDIIQLAPQWHETGHPYDAFRSLPLGDGPLELSIVAVEGNFLAIEFLHMLVSNLARFIFATTGLGGLTNTAGHATDLLAGTIMNKHQEVIAYWAVEKNHGWPGRD
ncbi:MAG: hypothetical protein M1817_001456 [Caeruleum heppii]|nr:MAG: hypothetical protein M1817_001456 [Caeruleum heppii]